MRIIRAGEFIAPVPLVSILSRSVKLPHQNLLMNLQAQPYSACLLCNLPIHSLI